MRADPITATCYAGIYPGRADQVSHVRRAVTSHLAGCPAANDAILVVSDSLNLPVYFFGPFWRVFVSGGRMGCRGLL